MKSLVKWSLRHQAPAAYGKLNSNDMRSYHIYRDFDTYFRSVTGELVYMRYFHEII